MSRANFFIVLVLVVALAGMFFWTLSIHNRQTEFGGTGTTGGSGPRAGAEMAARVDALENRLAILDQGQRALRGDVGVLEGRVEKLGSATDAQADALKALGAGGSVAAAAPAAGGGELVDTIEQVLADKEAKERREQRERLARQMSRFLLADIDATDDQRERFVTTITSYLGEREAVRARLDEQEADAQRRELAYAELDQNRNEELVRIFGAADFAKLEERLNRTRRGLEGRGGFSGRRPGGGGGGGSGQR